MVARVRKYKSLPENVFGKILSVKFYKGNKANYELKLSKQQVDKLKEEFKVA